MRLRFSVGGWTGGHRVNIAVFPSPLSARWVGPERQATAKSEQSMGTGAAVLKPADYRHYVDLFRIQERRRPGVYSGEGGEDSWAWMQHEIPWFDSSDKKFEEMYYFRWYAWKKHLVETPAWICDHGVAAEAGGEGRLLRSVAGCGAVPYWRGALAAGEERSRRMMRGSGCRSDADR